MGLLPTNSDENGRDLDYGVAKAWNGRGPFRSG